MVPFFFLEDSTLKWLSDPSLYDILPHQLAVYDVPNLLRALFNKVSMKDDIYYWFVYWYFQTAIISHSILLYLYM